MNENARMIKAAGTVAVFTLLSRILGFVRDMIMAFFFGSGLVTDAFIAAFRLPNLMRRLFAEGSLVLAFVPVFTEYLHTQGKDEAFRLAGSALKVLSVVLCVVTALCLLFSPWLLALIAPGFGESPDKMALALSLTRILFPYMFFICLVALCMGILNSLGHFAAPALAPVMLNVVMIGSILVATRISEDPVFRIKALAWGVIAGGALQLALQVPVLMMNGFRFFSRSPMIHEGLWRIGRMMIPSVLGAGVYQVNVLAVTVLASLLTEGSISWLYYADRLFQFPLGLFAISLGTAVLPSLSRQAAEGDLGGVKETFAQGVAWVSFITLPASIGLVVLSEPIVAVLFQRGEFGGYDVQMTAHALLFFSLGLWPVAVVRVTVPVFYARHEANTPVMIAVVSIGVNILLCFGLMGPFQHGGLALATSISSLINVGLLWVMLRRRLGYLGLVRMIPSFVRSLMCSLVMGYGIHRLAIYLIPSYNGPVSVMAVKLAACISAGILLYGLLAVLTRSPELRPLMAMIRKR